MGKFFTFSAFFSSLVIRRQKKSSEDFCQRGTRTNIQNWQENTCAEVSFLIIKLQIERLQLYEKEAPGQVFS